MDKKKYLKRKEQIVLAVQINLETDGFRYKKWGNEQRCKAGDWLVSNNGDCYTIVQETFENTYKAVAPGQFVKVAPVWAAQAVQSGSVKTEEGFTDYVEGDYIVSNNLDGTDDYAVSKVKFEAMYEQCD